MARKCCTEYDGKPCQTNYRATKYHPFEGGTVYSFPKDPDEQKCWEKSLPKLLICKISKNISVCWKHFLPDCPKEKKAGAS